MINQTRNRIISAIRSVLDEEGIDTATWTGNDLKINSKTVTELNPTPVSTLIIEKAFSAADTSTIYWHYTSLSNLRSMLKSRTFRLYVLAKRLKEDEYRPFCEDHDCRGYLEIDPATKRPGFEGLCKDLFYGSFVCADAKNESHMWEAFGDAGKGVRLCVRIQPICARTEFRSVQYNNALSKTLVTKVMKAVAAIPPFKFVLRGITRIAAFYLPLGYKIESESRLLLKRINGGPALKVEQDGDFEYFPIKFNSDSEYCRIDLIKIDLGPKMDSSEQSIAMDAWRAFNSEHESRNQ